MKWDYYIYRYITSYCVVRGLSPSSLSTYETDLSTFTEYMQDKKCKSCPTKVKAIDIYDYLEYMRVERNCTSSTVHKHSLIIKRFYMALVSLGNLEHYNNPMRNFRTVKRGVERVRDILSVREFKRLIKSVKEDSILGVRDRAMFLLLYTTGIRASELCGIKEKDIDFEGFQIKVFGKGQRERIVYLNKQVVKYLKKYLRVRGKLSRDKYFFRSRLGTGVSRKGLYDRIKKYVRLAGINKVISPHNLRHSFATILVESGKHTIVTVQKMLGHRSITSTIRYIRENSKDMRKAAEAHPINGFTDILNEYLPDVRMPFQLSKSGFK